jgi:hypothetical protein
MSKEIYQKLSDFPKTDLITNEIVINEDGSGSMDFETREQAKLFVAILELTEASIIPYEYEEESNFPFWPEVYVDIPKGTLSDNLHALRSNFFLEAIDVE